MTPKFSLQNVLDVRHSRVEAHQVELGQLLSFKQQAEGLLESFQAARAELDARLTEAQLGEIDLFAVASLRSNIFNTDQNITAVQAEIEKIDQAVAFKQRELVESKQDEEVLQILKRKRIETFNAEQALAESKTQDDIYIAQAFRQRQQGD